MSNLNIKLEEREEIILFGIGTKSNDKTVAKDIKNLSNKYNSKINNKGKIILPYFVVYKNYDKDTGKFDLFIGSLNYSDNLEYFKLPRGKYANTEIKPKFGFMWGLAIGEAKRYFYRKWILDKKYEIMNLEYEYHTEKSIGKSPAIEIFFGLK